MTDTTKSATVVEAVRIRRGRVDSVDLYEIKDGELETLEQGSPASLQLNFAIFLLSIAFGAICSLVTVTSFRSPVIETVFIVVAVVGTAMGAYLILAWRRNRTTVKALCAKIRGRIPPDVGKVATEVDAVLVEDSASASVSTEPKG